MIPWQAGFAMMGMGCLIGFTLWDFLHAWEERVKRQIKGDGE